MSWDAIGAIGELAGAAGVVISMLFLARQIREANRVAKAEAIRARGARMVNVWWRIAENDRLSAIIAHTFFDERPLAELSETDQKAFHAIARSLAMMWESEYVENKHGALDDDVWERRLDVIASTSLKPAYDVVWSDVRPILTDSFVRQLDEARDRLEASNPPRAPRSGSAGTDSKDHDDA